MRTVNQARASEPRGARRLTALGDSDCIAQTNRVAYWGCQMRSRRPRGREDVELGWRPAGAEGHRGEAAAVEQLAGAGEARAGDELARMDRGRAAETLLAMQQGQGNAAVARMVAGAHSGGAVLARRERKPQAPRVADTMAAAADKAEQEDPGESGYESALPKYRPSSIEEEVARIRALATSIREDQKLIDLGMAAKDGKDVKDEDGRKVDGSSLTPQMTQDNTKAILHLDEMTDKAANSSGALIGFQSGLGNLDRDHARLLAQMTTYAGSKQGKGAFTTSRVAAFVDDDKGQGIGQRIVASTGVAAGEFRRTGIGRDNPVAAHQGRADAARRAMTDRGRAIGDLYGRFRAKQDDMRAQLHAIESVVLDEQIGSAENKLAGLRERSSAARDMISQIGGLVSNVLGFSGWAQEPMEVDGRKSPSGDTRSAAGNIVTGAMMLAFDLINREENKRLEREINGLRSQLDGLKGAQHQHKLLAAHAKLDSERQLLVTAANTLVRAQGAFEEAQAEYRHAMGDMGAAADQAGGKGRDRFEVIAQLLSEADAYDAQAGVVDDLGRQFLTGAPTGLPSTSPGETVKHWRAKAYKGEKLYVVGTKEAKASWVSMWRQADAAGEVQRAIKELGGRRQEIGELAKELREVFRSRGPEPGTGKP
jgi:hypothetical protein